MGHRSETGCPPGDHDAGGAPQLALHAHAVGGDVGFPAVETGVQQLQQLGLVDRTAAQLEIDGHVVCDGRGLVERADVFRVGIDHRGKLLDIFEIPQGLDAAGRGAGPDGHEEAGGAPDLVDALGIVGRGDRTLYE